MKGFKVIAVHPELANEIGLNECLVLETLRREIKINYKVKNERHWYYHPLSKLRSEFLPFISVATISRAIASLESQKLIEVGEFNEMRADRTQWFSINLDECKKLQAGTIFQNEISILQNEKRSAKSRKVNRFQNEKSSGSPPTIFHNETAIQENNPAPCEELESKSTGKGNHAPNGAKPQRKKKPSAYDGLGDEFRPTYKLIYPLIAEICRVNLGTCEPRLRAEIDSAAAALAEGGANSELLKQYESEWKAKDWRGLKGEPPSVGNLRAGWDQPIGGNGNGNRYESAGERNERNILDTLPIMGIEIGDYQSGNPEGAGLLPASGSKPN